MTKDTVPEPIYTTLQLKIAKRARDKKENDSSSSKRSAIQRPDQQFATAFPTTTFKQKHWEAIEDTVEIAKSVVAAKFEADLRKGLEASLNLLSTPEDKGRDKRTPFLRQNEQGQCTYRAGQAPSRGGTKSLYSTTSPSGRQVLMGTREMGAGSANYCLYPMVTLETDLDKKSWITELPDALRISIKYGNNEEILLTGMHMTMAQSSNKKPTFFNQAQANKDYISNGSHISFDLLDKKSQTTSRLQLKPRVECIADSKGIIARAGGQMVALQVSKNNWPNAQRESLPKLNLATTRSKDGTLPFINNDAYSNEEEIIDQVINSKACLAIMSVINELARIGRYMNDDKMTYVEAIARVKEEIEHYEGADLNGENRTKGSPLSPISKPFIKTSPY